MNIDQKTGTIVEEGKITIYQHWEQCCICGEAPATIYFCNTLFKLYYYCPSHEKDWVKEYKPKTWFQKLMWFIDRRFV